MVSLRGRAARDAGREPARGRRPGVGLLNPTSAGGGASTRPRRRGIALAAYLGMPLLAGCVAIPATDELIRYTDAGLSRGEGGVCGEADRSSRPGKDLPAPMLADRFGLLSWNVAKARDAAWAEDFVRLGASRDLILLQEAHLTPAFLDLLGEHDYRWTMVRAFDLNGAEAGVLTASKVPATQGCLVRTAEPLVRVPKSVLITRYRLAGAPLDLLVANLHGVNFSLGTETYRRQLEDVAATLAHHPGPAILAGDFNTWSRARREILYEITESLGLRDLPLAQDRRSRVWGQALDHVFYRGLEVVAADSLVVSSSDHHPLRVTFRFRHNALEANP